MTRGGLHLVEVGIGWPPESFLRRKLEGLSAAGMSVTVATSSRGDYPAARRNRIARIRLPTGAESPLERRCHLVADTLRLLLRSPRTLRRIVAALRRTRTHASRRETLVALLPYLPILLARPDVVHFEWESAAVRCLPLFEACDCPVLVSVRGSGVNVHPHAGYERLAASYPVVFSRAAVVHCVSVAVREEAVRFGLDRARARVIRPAVDPGYFCPAGDGGGRRHGLHVVAVGELNWIKGYDDALEAIALLAGDGVPVSCEILGGAPAADSGKPDDRGRLQYLVHELALEQRVRFLGAVPEAVVRKRLRASDVLLQASLSEGLPNTVLEAMACAVPVVVTDCGGLREAVDDGVEGLVCPRRSPQALADALESLWRDPARARQMGHAGRARVLAEFTLATQLDSFKQLYEGVTAQRIRGA